MWNTRRPCMDFSADETRPGVVEQLVDATYPVWGEGLSRESYAAWNRAQRETLWGRRHLKRSVILEGDHPVSSAKWYDLRAKVSGRDVRVLGIGAVHTPPQLRRRGLARQLLESMIDAAGHEGYDLALLFSEIGPEYYEPLGFQTIPRTTQTLEVLPFRRGAPAALVRSGEAGDLRSIATLSARAAEDASFALERSAEFVGFMLARRRLLAGLSPAGLRQIEFLVTEEAYNAPAYVIISRGPGGPVLEACGDLDATGARVGAMLQALVARDSAEPGLRLRTSLPSGFRPQQIHVAEESDAAEVMMIRAIGSSPIDVAAIDPARVIYWPLDVF
jgi:GNAT superfamily N-acetyltransferase